MNINPRLAAIGGGLVLAFSLVACGGGAGDLTPAETTTATETGTEPLDETAGTSAEGDVGTAHNDADTTFAQMMIIHHEGAVEMADLAVIEASSHEVRTLAERISAAQRPEIENMTSWLEAWGEETAPMDHGGMDHGGMDMGGMDQEEVMAELETLSGTEFDRRFLELMILHHEGAIEMSQTELESGQDPEALELAQRIILDQEAEITEMEQMLANL